jgi:hypothetical protein
VTGRAVAVPVGGVRAGCVCGCRVMAGCVALFAILLVSRAVAPAASLALPPGRHYEMVSPVFKAGFGATVPPLESALSADGRSVLFYSPGIFAGAPSTVILRPDYLARRTQSGWVSTPLAIPASMSSYHQEDLSPDLGLELSVGSPTPHEYELRERVVAWVRSTWLPDLAESWLGPTNVAEVAGRDVTLEYVTGSADLCHALMEPSINEVNVNSAEPIAEAQGTTGQLYDVNRGCHGEPAGIALVGVNNRAGGGKLLAPGFAHICRVNVGNTGITIAPQTSSYNAVSGDGSEVFFSDCTGAEPKGGEERHQLFVRLGGRRTVEVSRPLEGGPFGGCVGEGKGPAGEVPCEGASGRASADFVGASEDGARVYFTATLEGGEPPLVPGDSDGSMNLYMATIGCPQSNPACAPSEREVTGLSEVSHDPNGAAAQVQGVLRVAPDGRRVYFVASGDLLTAPEQQALEAAGRPVPSVGAANLYVYDGATGAVAFIADLCTERERSGAAEDIRCPSEASDHRLWTSGSASAGESQTGGPGGQFLVFSTYAQLTSEDTNTVRDVYRFDAQTGALTRVSYGENRYEPHPTLGARIAEGHRVGDLIAQHGLDVRAISDDGSRIVFTSADPLSPSDTNGLVNAYEWHDGAVSLVSTGGDLEGVSHVVISADGSSVVFDTAQSLVPQDTDILSDVYVARLGEGFPGSPAEAQGCEGDGCQGPLTTPAPLLVPGSASQAAGENLPAAATAVPGPHAKPKAWCKHGLKRNNHRRCVKTRRTERRPSRRGRR